VKTIPKNVEKSIQGTKNTKKSKNFRKNSQRWIGGRTIQIKYLEFMKRILEPSNK
jgi:hypothetical protein